MNLQNPKSCSLDDCFQAYTQKEQLGAENAWFCPNCRKRQQGTLKALNLSTLPNVLIIHLKRFKQDLSQRTKLNTLVTFPIYNLNLFQHLSTKPVKSTNENFPEHPSNLSIFKNLYDNSSNTNFKDTQNQSNLSFQNIKNDEFNHKSNLRKSNCKFQRNDCDDIDNVDLPSSEELYNLYAVCNHYGNMNDGHYTAFCKNPINNQWYCFNDTQVTPLKETDVITRAAYILFYRKVKPPNINNSKKISFNLNETNNKNIKLLNLNKNKPETLNLDQNNLKNNIDFKSSFIIPCNDSPEFNKNNLNELKKNNFSRSLDNSFPSEYFNKIDENTKELDFCEAISCFPNKTSSLNSKDIASLSGGKSLNDNSKEFGEIRKKQQSLEKDENCTAENIHKSSSKAIRRNKKIKSSIKSCCVRSMLCSASVFTSDDSVICADTSQLSQLHSLQESRV